MPDHLHKTEDRRAWGREILGILQKQLKSTKKWHVWKTFLNSVVKRLKEPHNNKNQQTRVITQFSEMNRWHY